MNMEPICFHFLPIIGLLGGFLSGLLGLGGGIVMVPVLTLIGKIPTKLATGTSLVHVMLAAATGTLSYSRVGIVDFQAGIILGLAGIAGGVLGSIFSVTLSNYYLNIIFLNIVILAILCLFIPLKSKENYIKGSFNKIKGTLIGLGCGFLVGLLGVGGGFIIIPSMVYFLGMPLRETIGTSLMIILISSLGTFIAKYGVGHIDTLITLFVIPGSIGGSLIGTYIGSRTKVQYIRLMLISLLFLIFITVSYQTFLN